MLSLAKHLLHPLKTNKSRSFAALRMISSKALSAAASFTLSVIPERAFD